MVILFIHATIAEEYFVTLKNGEDFERFYASDTQYPEELRVKQHIRNTFSIGTFRGFVGNFTKTALTRLKNCPYISEITPDIQIHALKTVVQTNSPRHLGRISQRKKLQNDINFIYDDEASGYDVNAYVIDSGIEAGHPEFGDRVRFGKDFTDEGTGDNNGHGTHVAGIIGSSTYGVSKQVNIIEVKALAGNGMGSLSKIIAALEFCVNDAKVSGRLSVANLSLGAEKNAILNNALDAAVNDGLVLVVAAGNAGINACKTSPGSAEHAITVGSIDDRTDNFASFSNYGPCVDILAPGVMVESVDFTDTSSSKFLSGTSMSSPIVSGMVANLLSGGIHPVDIKSTLLRLASNHKVKKVSLVLKGKTPNKIAYLGIQLPEDTQESELQDNEDDHVYDEQSGYSIEDRQDVY